MIEMMTGRHPWPDVDNQWTAVRTRRSRGVQEVSLHIYIMHLTILMSDLNTLPFFADESDHESGRGPTETSRLQRYGLGLPQSLPHVSIWGVSG